MRRWQSQIERYGPAVIHLLNEIADTYLDQIDRHIVAREETVIDAFSAAVEFRWRLILDIGDKEYFPYDVEAVQETNSLGFRSRFIAEPERVPMTGDVESDLEKLRAICLKAFSEGRAGAVRYERKGLLAGTDAVYMKTAQGDIELRPMRYR